jgi:hypothetical protein
MTKQEAQGLAKDLRRENGWQGSSWSYKAAACRTEDGHLTGEWQVIAENRMSGELRYRTEF